MKNTDQESLSLFSNWLTPSAPQGLLLTKTKDLVLYAATSSQQYAGNEHHSVLVLINSPNPLWECITVPDASIILQNWHASVSMLHFTAQIREFWE